MVFKKQDVAFETYVMGQTQYAHSLGCIPRLLTLQAATPPPAPVQEPSSALASLGKTSGVTSVSDIQMQQSSHMGKCSKMAMQLKALRLVP